VSFLYAGVCISKPYVISLLEQGKEPWEENHKMTRSLLPGEMGKPGKSFLEEGWAILEGLPPHLGFSGD
jgi:hypothetical protein